jgi:hypothetical protein
LREIVVKVLEGTPIGNFAGLEAGPRWPVLRMLLEVISPIVTGRTDNEVSGFLAELAAVILLAASVAKGPNIECHD